MQYSCTGVPSRYSRSIRANCWISWGDSLLRSWGETGMGRGWGRRCWKGVGSPTSPQPSPSPCSPAAAPAPRCSGRCRCRRWPGCGGTGGRRARMSRYNRPQMSRGNHCCWRTGQEGVSGCWHCSCTAPVRQGSEDVHLPQSWELTRSCSSCSQHHSHTSHLCGSSHLGRES